MQQLSVFVNDIPVTPGADRLLAPDARMQFERTLTFESDQTQNELRVEVDHGRSLGVVETYAEVAGALPKQAPRGRLFLLSIGINRFVNIDNGPRKNELLDLAFAAQDAQAFAQVLQQSAQGLFSDVKVVTLTDFTDAKPDKAEILKALGILQDVGPDDMAVVFLASHGFSDDAGNYFFMTRDGQLADVDRVAHSTGKAIQAPSLIEGAEFFEALRTIPGRRVLIVDTCRALNIEGRPADTHLLRKRSAASKLAFLVAAKGRESSQEYLPGQHGLFTYALMESLKAKADTNGDGIVTLSEAFEHLKPIVEQLRERTVPQTPQLIAPDTLAGQPLAAVAKGSR